nr:secretin N-terminal domain-containing protein [Rhizobiaceae bacterium]
MRAFLFIASLLLLAGCTLSDSDSKIETVLGSLDSTGKPLPNNSGNNSRTLFGTQSGQQVQQITAQGSGQFVSGRAPAIVAEPRTTGENGYTLNLLDAPIAAAAKSVLGDTLGVNYTVDGSVRGNLTLQTSNPVSEDSLIDIFEAALATNGATIVQSGGTYQIVPLGSALANTPAVSVPSVARSGPGVQVQVIELKYISAEEMRNILSPISRDGSILKTDDARNYIMIAGTRANLAAMRDAISVFDVDWMRGMSVALHPLTTSQPAEVARELETIFGVNEGPGSKIIRFVPNDRLKSVLVITSRPTYLRRAANWIRKLDRLADSSEDRLFVYNIQNRPAAELAEVLQSVLSGQTTGSQSSSSVSPDLSAVEVSAEGNGTGSGPDGSPLTASTTSKDGVETSVVADEENNALLISTTAREYKRIEQILLQLDVLPTQVFLEAVIAEVSLNDELKFGVRWFFESGNFDVTLTDLAVGAVANSFPGLGVLFE